MRNLDHWFSKICSLCSPFSPVSVNRKDFVSVIESTECYHWVWIRQRLKYIFRTSCKKMSCCNGPVVLCLGLFCMGSKAALHWIIYQAIGQNCSLAVCEPPGLSFLTGKLCHLGDTCNTKSVSSKPQPSAKAIGTAWSPPDKGWEAQDK